ncbi:MAG: TIGR03643 family protein [Porticoccaceae bacterium]
MAKNKYQFSSEDISRIIEMAWEDRTPFEAIEYNYGINESSVIKLMRSNVTLSSFKLWRKRVSNRSTKHFSKRPSGILRAYCPTQYKNR